MKSERLRKLESELTDLEQWLKLGLVPRKDLEKHKEEMRLLSRKIDEEKERLRFLKESGEGEEFTMPKKPAGRQPVREPHSLPDLDSGGEGYTETGFEMETESLEMETTSAGEGGGGEEAVAEEVEEEPYEEEEEDPFSDRNRWRRGVLEDPDADQW